MDHAKACCQTVMTLKMKCWDTLPWKLCGIAHPFADTARRCTQEALAQFNATPKGLASLHHPLTTVLLDPDEAPRAALEEFAEGRCSREDFPTAVTELVLALLFIPICERVVEAQHKDVKRALAKFTSQGGGARASIAIRHLELVRAMHDSPEGSRQVLLEAFGKVRKSWDLVLASGLGGHPSLGGLRGQPLLRACQAAVCRCDLDAQYFDHGSATRFDRAEKNSEQKDGRDLQKRNSQSAQWQHLSME